MGRERRRGGKGEGREGKGKEEKGAVGHLEGEEEKKNKKGVWERIRFKLSSEALVEGLATGQGEGQSGKQQYARGKGA